MNVFPLQIAPVTPAAAYLGAAEAMLEGVRVLAANDPPPAIALTQLGGQSLECALKSFLAKSGLTEKELSGRKFGHELIRLWTEAAARGLSIPTSPPDWVAHLDRVYSSPYVARYPMGIHGLVLPNCAALAAGVEQVVKQVRTA